MVEPGCVPNEHDCDCKWYTRQNDSTIDGFGFVWHQRAQRYKPLENEPKNRVWNDQVKSKEKREDKRKHTKVS